MNKEEWTKEEKDALKRLERMSQSDICDMSSKNLARLACNFSNEQLVRKIVAKGETKEWKKKIFERIGYAYKMWFSDLSLWHREDYRKRGYGTLSRYYFKDIFYDIESNLSLLPHEDDDDECDDDESQTSDSPDDMKAELEELREQVEQYRKKEKGTSLGLNQAQAALFGLALANTFSFNYTNKKKQLAPMLHKLFGWGESKLAAYLSTPCDKEKRDELANLFKDLCPPLYDTIMNWGELPK